MSNNLHHAPDRVAEIERQITEARPELADLERAAPQLASEAKRGGPREHDILRAVREKIRTLRADIEDCELALIYEREQADKKMRARQTAEQNKIKKRGMKKAAAFYAGLIEESRLLAVVIAQHQKNMDLASEARAALPLREPIKVGFLLGHPEIRDCINREIARVDAGHSHSAETVPRRFPRASGLGLGDALNPAAMKPLAEKVAEAQAALERELQTNPAFPAAVTNRAPATPAPVSAAAPEPNPLTFDEAKQLVQAEAERLRQQFPDN